MGVERMQVKLEITLPRGSGADAVNILQQLIYQLFLRLGQTINFVAQLQGHRAGSGKGEDQNGRPGISGDEKTVKFQRLVKNDLPSAHVGHPIVGTDAQLSVQNVQALPEIMGLPGKLVALVIMDPKEGVHIADLDLQLDRVSGKDHFCCHKNTSLGHGNELKVHICDRIFY